jgi:GNAT superfamily N-acetyltransferase
MATAADVPLILHFIRLLARYEKLEHHVVATDDTIREYLFGPHAYAEVVFAELDRKPVGFALFFPTFSTFVGRPGIYLEDLYVLEEMRGRGIGRQLLSHLARLTVERGWGRLDWAVLDWNTPAIGFYNKLGALMLTDWRICRLTGQALETLAGRIGSDRVGSGLIGSDRV